jgi:glycosyltransferase involved in cell wall biosynthesis
VSAPTSGAPVCHLNLARGFRGGERQTEILIRALAGRVRTQHLVTRAETRLGQRLEGTPGVAVTVVRDRFGALAATSGAALVHAHETWGAQVACVRRALSGTPYIVTRRVDKRPRANLFTRSVYRRAEIVVVLSDAIGRLMSAYEPGLDLRKIPSASSDLHRDEAWVRRFREENRGRFIVGTIGALVNKHKGQLILLQAARLLADSHPQIRFVLVGSGRDAERLQSAAGALPNVHFAGWVENVGDYLAGFDLFVFPSLSEGLGSILIDAMQFGLPIVASRVGGIPELVSDRDNALLTPAGDARAMAQAIVELYSDPALRNAMSVANRQRAQEYRPSVMANRYAALYREILPRLETGAGS